MLKITAIGTENLRSLADTGLIAIKPITILVGRNSAGKSTFARLLPLLKQSNEAAKKGPLLWWGRLVDFGSFEDTVSRNSTQKEISLKFRIDFTQDEFKNLSRRSLGRLSIYRLTASGTLDARTTIKNSANGPYVSSVDISAFDFTASVFLDPNGFIVKITSNEYTWHKTDNIIGYASQDGLFPEPSFFKVVQKNEKDSSTNYEVHDVFGFEIAKTLRHFLHGNTAEEKVRQLAGRIPLGSRASMYEGLKQITNPPTFRENLISEGPNSPTFRRLCNLVFASYLEPLMSWISEANRNLSDSVFYLEPLRANAQRYYRQQSLAVGEIDSKGENIAMFLDNLSKTKLGDLNEWLDEHFTIRVSAKKEGGHISLKIKQTHGGGESNIADMGFGFSQMLPIAIQLWSATLKGPKNTLSARTKKFPTLVIEQPELHLHPDYQAKLADVFVATACPEPQAAGLSKSPKDPVRIIAETHSADLINRLGTLISEGKAKPEDVQVILFEQVDSQSPSKLTFSGFDDDGVLINWPSGFFTPNIYHR